MDAPTTIVYQGQSPILVKRRTNVVVVAGPDEGKRAPLEVNAVRVGTAPDNTIVLTDPLVSRHHLEIRVSDTGYRVEDRGSTNGTFHHGARVQRVFVGQGAELRLGGTVLRLERGEETSAEVDAKRDYAGLIGDSPPMQKIYGILSAVAPTDTTVLLEGETGTGKEAIAEALHAQSSRAGGPFRVIDCGALSTHLVEAELFGHERGAFTGALKSRPGIFESARGGTVFIDEIAELPLDLQTRLLRVFDRRETRRVGSDWARKVDVRIVAATHRSLRDEVARGRFREDLYYRVSVIRIELPPLRERGDDVLALARFFLRQSGYADSLTPELEAKLKRRKWRGNLRELRNVIDRVVAMADSSFSVDTDPARAVIATPAPLAASVAVESAPPHGAPRSPTSNDRSWLAPLLPTDLLRRPFKEAKLAVTREFEGLYLRQLLSTHGESISALARQAGVDRQAIRRLLKRHGVELCDP